MQDYKYTPQEFFYDNSFKDYTRRKSLDFFMMDLDEKGWQAQQAIGRTPRQTYTITIDPTLVTEEYIKSLVAKYKVQPPEFNLNYFVNVVVKKKSFFQKIKDIFK